jgi:hypothetical protein
MTPTITCVSFAADPGARFITTSLLGLGLDIFIMQPGRVFVVAIIMVTPHTHTHTHTDIQCICTENTLL